MSSGSRPPRQRKEVFVPLVYKPGDVGEGGFFEVLVDLRGAGQGALVRAASHALGP